MTKLSLNFKLISHVILYSLKKIFSNTFSQGCNLKPEAIRHLQHNQLIHAYFAKAFEMQGLKVNSSPPGWSFEGLTIPMGKSLIKCLLIHQE